MKRKLCSVLCSICLILTLLPVHAAAEGEPAAPATYTITFDANGGEGTMASQTVTAGAGVTLNANTFTRKGYSFKGWATTADGAVSGYSDGQTLTSACIQKNMTLYAQWVQQTLAGTVTVTGNKDTGVLTAAVTDANNSGDLQYQWYRGGGEIADATTNTYTMTKEDVGVEIACHVTSNGQPGEIVGSADYRYGGDVGNGLLITSGNSKVPTYYKAGNGYVEVEAQAKSSDPCTVTLHDATITGSTMAPLALAGNSYVLQVEGTNTLTAAYSDSLLCISAYQRTVSVQGDGTLNLNGGNFGICADEGSVTVGGSVTLQSTCQVAGISAKDVTITGSASDCATSGNYGVKASHDVTINSTGKVNLTAQYQNTCTYSSTNPQSGVWATKNGNPYVYTVYGQYEISGTKSVDEKESLTVNANATLTIPSAGTLSLDQEGAVTIQNGGKIVNNGCVRLSANYASDISAAIKRLNLTGTGRVQVGQAMYDNNGVKQSSGPDQPSGGTSVDLTSRSQTVPGVCTWTVSGDSAVLELEDSAKIARLSMPACAKNITVRVKNNGKVTMGEMSVSSLKTGNVSSTLNFTGGTFQVVNLMALSFDQIPISLTISNGAKIFSDVTVGIMGSGTLTITGSGSALQVMRSSFTSMPFCVAAEEILVSNGAALEVAAAPTASQVCIHAKGLSVTNGSALTVAGNAGVIVANGTIKVDSTSALNADCAQYALFAISTKQENPLTLDNLPAELETAGTAEPFDYMTGRDKTGPIYAQAYGWSVVKKGDKLTVKTKAAQMPDIAGAVKTLTLKPTAANPGIQPSGINANTNTDTKTITNKDGSKTTTVTDKTTGTVTQTTKSADGAVQTVETRKDGTVATKLADKAGNTLESVKKPDGSMTATVTKTDGTKVESKTADGKTTATVTLPSGAEKATVTIPTPEKPKTGMVAVITKPDGTKQIVKNSVPTADGVAVTLTGGATVELVDNAKPFKDVPADNWAKDAVDFVSARGMMNGATSTSFNPQQTMNRAMIWSVLYRQNVDNAADSASGKWYENAQKWAQENNLSDGSNPTGGISRQQLVTILWRAAGSPKADGTLASYADASSVANYAKEALAWAVKAGIVSGTDAKNLSPESDASRVQVAAILMRYLQNLAK